MATTTPAPIDFAIVDGRGYWLTPDGWGEHADATRFDQLRDAATAALELGSDLWSLGLPRPRPWDVTEGYPAVVEPCRSCNGTGRKPEDDPYHLKRGLTERACRCWGYGTQAVIALTTVQLGCDSTPDGHPVHLVRETSINGCPGPLLCGLDFRAPDGPDYDIGGGTTGPAYLHTPCPGCATAATANFTGLPISGSAGGREMAAHVGVSYDGIRPSRRPWHDERDALRKELLQAPPPPRKYVPDAPARPARSHHACLAAQVDEVRQRAGGEPRG